MTQAIAIAGKNLDHGVVNRVGHDRVFVRFHVVAIDFREAVVGLAFAVEKLQHNHPANVFLQIRIDACNGNANTPVGIAHAGRGKSSWRKR